MAIQNNGADDQSITVSNKFASSVNIPTVATNEVTFLTPKIISSIEYWSIFSGNITIGKSRIYRMTVSS